MEISTFGFEKNTYTGKFGPFDYLVVPKLEYTNKLVADVHGLPFSLSEWRDFYRCRFKMVNGVGDPEDVPGNFVNLPVITAEECHKLGL